MRKAETYIYADFDGKVEVRGETSSVLTTYTAITKALLEEGIKKEYLEIALELAEANDDNLAEKGAELIMKTLLNKLKKTKEE